MLNPVTEGWTEPIDHQLLNDGVPVLIQGFAIALILKDKTGAVIDTTGKVTNLDVGTEGTKGRVRYSPASTDLVVAKSTYKLRWKVTDAGGKIAFWPNGKSETLTVNIP